MFKANARRIGRDFVGGVACETAESAAAHLLMLMKADGYGGDEAETLEQLVRGEAVQHKRFEYQVTEGGGA
ncbi:hypothetical protein ACFVVX_02960 [Kitasatospora sp. NPDC058170]|uniref:hypothetical protein n=1 Tax=Kitasatospora sp. NPDC058170 TaxID=3346364 RepID=UPI0036DB8E2F